VVTVETPVPIWDFKQGHVYEARANWARAEAAVRSTATRLSRDVAETWARYEAARQEVDRLQREVLPKVQETVELLRKGYEAGAPSVSFNDLILTEQSFNTTRLRLAETRQTLWLAVADLQGLMQLDVGEEYSCPLSVPPLSRWVPAPPCRGKPD
jgi:outer membrane protein TolC